MIADGVELLTRTPDASCDGGKPGSAYIDLRARVAAIRGAFSVSASMIIRRLYVDDKNCALYEVDLVDDVPTDLAESMAGTIVNIFRSPEGGGGYNGLDIRLCGTIVLRDDPWWNECGGLFAANDP